ncbi:Cilia- and flagella-associated protein 206 [Blattella germanica]|nr:Cilia- and flagella-associated protein 206 [Blattella germanica]
MVLNPSHGFISDRPLARDDVQLLVDICVQKLSEELSPSLATIQMQVYFDTNFAPREDIINENHTSIKLRTTPLIKEIIESDVKSSDDLEKLYPALSSVFPESELSQFMAMSRRDKEQQITELTQITTGIRLFNRDCQKGGEGIEDLPNILQKANNATQSALESQLQKLLEKINTYTTAVERYFKQMQEEQIDVNGKEEEEEGEEEKTEQVEEESEEEIGVGGEEETEEEGDSNILPFLKLCDIPKQQIQMVFDGVATSRQQEVYLRKLLGEVEIAQQTLAELLDKLDMRLSSIHDTVRFRTAIPTVQVYPQFIHMSEIWSGLQDEMVLLSNINNLAWNLHKHIQVLDYIEESTVKCLIGDSEILTDEARLEATTGIKIYSEGMQCEVVYPAQVTDFDKIPLQYLGFCAWSLVEGKGALIPGNPNMGVCRWKGNYYAFSSPTAATEFGQDPDRFVMMALSLVREKPELINLLQLQEQVAAVRTMAELPIKKPEPIIKRDTEIQTELHPVPTNIDPHYRWNEWDMKRDAIKLTNICSSKTRSVQTLRSHHRTSKIIQASPSKEKEIQTMRDETTNVPTLQNFIYGLRGRKDDKQFIVTLTRPVKERSIYETC